MQARRYGVRAAMPGFIARKLCPELIFVPVDFKKYTHYSNLTRKGLNMCVNGIFLGVHSFYISNVLTLNVRLISFSEI